MLEYYLDFEFWHLVGDEKIAIERWRDDSDPQRVRRPAGRFTFRSSACIFYRFRRDTVAYARSLNALVSFRDGSAAPYS